MITFQADLSVNFIDAAGTRDSLVMGFESQVDLATLLSGMAAWLPLLDACLDVQIISATVKMTLPLSGLKSTPIPGSNCSRGAQFDYVVEGSDRRYSIFYPGWKPLLLVGDQVVRNSTTFALSDNFSTAGGNGPFFTDRYRNPVNIWLKGRLAFRKLRKALSRAR